MALGQLRICCEACCRRICCVVRLRTGVVPPPSPTPLDGLVRRASGWRKIEIASPSVRPLLEGIPKGPLHFDNPQVGEVGGCMANQGRALPHCAAGENGWRVFMVCANDPRMWSLYGRSGIRAHQVVGPCVHSLAFSPKQRNQALAAGSCVSASFVASP